MPPPVGGRPARDRKREDRAERALGLVGADVAGMPVERAGQLEPLDRLHHQAQRLLGELPHADQVARHPRGADQVELREQAPLELRITIHRLTIGA
jgi:hypothetical protein